MLEINFERCGGILQMDKGTEGLVCQPYINIHWPGLLSKNHSCSCSMLMVDYLIWIWTESLESLDYASLSREGDQTYNWEKKKETESKGIILLNWKCIAAFPYLWKQLQENSQCFIKGHTLKDRRWIWHFNTLLPELALITN